MKDISGDIEYKGKSYKLVFNLNVMEAIQEEFGSLDAWGELTDAKSGEPNIKAVKFGFMTMLNEGIDIENENKEVPDKPFTIKQVGRMLTEIGVSKATQQLNDTVVESTKSADDRKNESSKTKSTQS